ncbi:MAG: hypothetical protein V4450_11315 [Bacteroidota bacterium]
MDTRKLLLLLICFVSVAMAKAQIPARKFDTSMKVGKTGYKLSCNNKNPDRNVVMITPIGFDKDVRDFSFEVKGRITKAEVDDINRDGFPDLVFYVFTIGLDSLPKGNVIGISSEGNQSVALIGFPDIYDDPKLRIGYKGNDEFFLMEGYLVRRFPVAPAAGAPAPTTPGVLYRQIQYMVVPGERGSKFKPMRSYEFTKQ